MMSTTDTVRALPGIKQWCCSTTTNQSRIDQPNLVKDSFKAARVGFALFVPTGEFIFSERYLQTTPEFCSSYKASVDDMAH